MERDFSLTYVNAEGKTKRIKLDHTVFDAGKPHDVDCLIHMCIVQDEKTKAKDSKKGVEATLQVALEGTDNCEFGVWTNGDEFHFLQKKTDVERDAANLGEDYEVFMAITETVGKDRRGVPIYKRDEDGSELLYDDKKEVLFSSIC